MANWVDKYNLEVEFPEYLNTLADAIKFYDSIYDLNQTKIFPPIMILPPHITINPESCMILFQARYKACYRRQKDLLETSFKSNKFLFRKIKRNKNLKILKNRKKKKFFV